MEKINTKLICLSFFWSVFLCFSQVIYAQTALLAPGGQDYEALKALYEAIDGDNWKNNTGWDLSGNVSVTRNWVGVTVRNGRVVSMSLSHNRLSGDIPPEIGNLTNLRWLYLGNNQLTTLPLRKV